MFLKFKKLKMRNKEFYQIGQFDLMIMVLRVLPQFVLLVSYIFETVLFFLFAVKHVETSI